jgi:hypothetical protein
VIAAADVQRFRAGNQIRASMLCCERDAVRKLALGPLASTI